MASWLALLVPLKVSKVYLGEIVLSSFRALRDTEERKRCSLMGFFVNWKRIMFKYNFKSHLHFRFLEAASTHRLRDQFFCRLAFFTVSVTNDKKMDNIFYESNSHKNIFFHDFYLPRVVGLRVLDFKSSGNDGLWQKRKFK